MDRPPEIAAEVAPWARPAVMLPVLALFSLVGGQFPSFSPQANLYVLAIGGALIWLGLSGRAPRRPAPRRIGSGVGWWLLPALAFLVVEGVTFLDGTERYPTLSLLADPLLDDSVVRSAAFFGWLTAFWALVRR